MDTAQLLLISQARQGEPKSIAALIQHELQHQGIEVCGWKKGTTLHLELMGRQYPARAEVLQFIKNGLSFLKAEGIEAARLVVYVEGEDHPRWVERIGLKGGMRPKLLNASPDVTEAGMTKEKREIDRHLGRSIVNSAAQGFAATRHAGIFALKPFKELPIGNPAKLAAVAVSTSLILALGFSFSLRTVQPSFAEQNQQSATQTETR